MTSITQVLVALHVLISLTAPRAELQQVDALPITSKPIESTAENLAWQAWIMMPPHEQNLEKSRKVTPKSIFLLPNRVKPSTANGQPWTIEAESGSGLYAPIECPPGQRQYESRCISTLDIDREQLLIQELQILLQHGGTNNNQNAYDYDYDYDEESVAAVEANYKAPMMFKGEDLAPAAISGNFDDAVRLPNEDAPLKFNIFSDNYPTDLEVPHKQPNVMDMGNQNKSSSSWSMPQSLGLAETPSELYTMPHTSNMATSSSATTTKTLPLGEGFPITGIDAIVLPAKATSSQLQKFAFFKDDGGLQLVSTAATNQKSENTDVIRDQLQESTAHIADLLKFDSLLPLNSSIVAPLAAPTTAATATTPLATTATIRATLPETLSTRETKITTAGQQFRTVSSSKTTRTVGVDLHPSKATTTTTIAPHQTQLSLDEANDHATQRDQQEKAENTRSVTLVSSMPTASTTENEPKTITNLLMSTLLPATTSTTTSISSNNQQLDETTPIEMPAKAADVERQGSSISAQALQNQKKLKVNSVAEKTTLITDDDDNMIVNQTTPLPTLHSLQSAQQKVVNHNNEHHDRSDVHHYDADPDLDDNDEAYDDRFSYQPAGEVETTVADDVDEDASGHHEVRVGESTLSQLVPAKSTIKPTITTTTTTTAQVPAKNSATTTTKSTTTINSEIDVAAELRAINQLVKQNNRRVGAMNKKNTVAAKLTTKSDLATTKPTSRLKTIEQQMEKTTTESVVDVDMESDMGVSISASSETTATMLLKVNDAVTPKASQAPTETAPTIVKAAPTTSKAATTTMATEATSTTSPTPTVLSTDEATATATLWAKILPLLGYGLTTTKTKTTAAPTSTSTPYYPASATSPTTTQISSNKSSISSTNRSLRNSKITRIDKLSTNSLTDGNAKTTTTTATTPTTKRISSGSRSKVYVVPLVQTTESTVLPPSATTAQARNSASDENGVSGFSPFWWLPTGWRLDRPTTVTPSSSSSSLSTTTSSNKRAEAAATAEPSLLLRFWSAFPGNQVKVKE